MKKFRWISEELVKIKAYQIWEERKDKGVNGRCEQDWMNAWKYLKKHWWEVLWWRLKKIWQKRFLLGFLTFLLSLLLKIALVFIISIGLFWITPIIVKKARTLPTWTGFSETEFVTTNIKKDDKTTVIKQTYPGKTLWDWLELSSRLAVPILLAIFGYQVKKRDKERSEEQDKLKYKLSQINSSEEAIQAYLDSIARLLLDKDLRKELFRKDHGICDNLVRDVARIRTVIILRRLEGHKDYQARIIHFLRDAKLHEFILTNADLSRIDLAHTDLWKVNLQGAKLGKANLQETVLAEANLQQADLWQANLQGASLWKANLQEANLWQANLQEADLWAANLQKAVIDTEKVTFKQIKLACHWKDAIHKSEYNFERGKGGAIEPDNEERIHEIEKDEKSNPRELPDCSCWKR